MLVCFVLLQQISLFVFMVLKLKSFYKNGTIFFQLHKTHNYFVNGIYSINEIVLKTTLLMKLSLIHSLFSGCLVCGLHGLVQ